MNILVIPMTDWLHHPVPSGMNHYCDVLAERHNVYVLNFRFGQYTNNPELPTKCKIVPVDEQITTTTLIPYYVLNSPNIRAAIRLAIEEYDIDVILSSNILPSWFANGLGVPVVFDYRDVLDEAAALYFGSPWMKWLVANATNPFIAYNLRHADQITTITPELGDYISKRYKLNGTKITAIPCGVDTTRFTLIDKPTAKRRLLLHKDTKVIGYVGSIEPWIDLRPAIDNTGDLGVLLLIIGPALHTTYLNYLKQYAANLYGKESPVEWLGGVPYDQLPQYIQAMDIGLNPLRLNLHNNYSFGSKIMNYIACGTPVLSTPVVSLIKKVLCSNPLPIRFYLDKHSFKETAQEMLDNPVPPAGQEVVEQYDWRNLAKRYEEVLFDAIE